jgi:signal transduction histidine kinase
MKRLYLQVYLTLVASLLVFALVAGVFWREFADRAGYGQFAGLASEVVEAVLPPPGDSQAAQEAALRRWAERMRARMTLYDAEGRPIASAGKPLALTERHSHWHGRDRAWTLQLSDGRWLVARRDREHRRPPLAGFLLLLFGVGIAVAAGAYPVVRRVTRRLERLQDGVEALGSGDLKARVKVEGSDEIARLAAQFNRSAEEIERLVGAHRTLLANASHELRSPLARIRMALEMSPMDEQAKAGLARDIAEIDALIDEILLASRLDAVQGDGPREDVDLLALAAEEAARVDAIAGGEPCLVKGEARLLRRMIRNLLENARRHADGAPPEVLVHRAADGGAEIEVLDSGPGVPDAERERIFEPFYRPSGAREGDGGYGLGLALVRQIARRHGGEVTCLGREGGGSRFLAKVPAST